MLSDIEIAEQAVLDPIADVAQKVGLSSDELEFYGKYKAKIPLNAIKSRSDKKDGKLVM